MSQHVTLFFELLDLLTDAISLSNDRVSQRLNLSELCFEVVLACGVLFFGGIDGRPGLIDFLLALAYVLGFLGYRASLFFDLLALGC